MAVIYFDTPAHYTSSPTAQYFQDRQERAHRSRRSSLSKTTQPCKMNDWYTKYVHRQVVLAWKRVTRATRKPERTAILPDGFVIIGAQARRRSIFFG